MRTLATALAVIASVAALTPGLGSSFSKVHSAVASVATTQDIRQSDLPFVVDDSVGGGAAAILKEADYQPFASIHTDSETFTLAKGSAHNLLLLPEIFDVDVYDPSGELDEHDERKEHIIVGHFAAGLKDIDRQFEALASVRDHISRSYDAPVVACTFLCETTGEIRKPDPTHLSGIADFEDFTDHITVHKIPTAVETKAKENGVMVFFGEDLGLTVEVAKLKSECIAALGDLIKLNANLTTTKDELAFEKEARVAAEARATNNERRTDAAEDRADAAEKDRDLEKKARVAAEEENRKLLAKLSKLEAGDDSDDTDATSPLTE